MVAVVCMSRFSEKIVCTKISQLNSRMSNVIQWHYYIATELQKHRKLLCFSASVAYTYPVDSFFPIHSIAL